MNEHQLPTFEEHLYTCKQIQKNTTIQLRRTKKHLARYKKLKDESKINIKEYNDMVKYLTAIENYLTEDVKQNGNYIQAMRNEKMDVIAQHKKQIEVLEDNFNGSYLELEKNKLKLKIGADDLVDRISGRYVSPVKTTVTVLDDVAMISQGWAKLELKLTDEVTLLDETYLIKTNTIHEENFRHLVDQFKCIHFKNWLSNNMTTFVYDESTGNYCVKMKHTYKDSGEVNYFILSI